MARNDYRLFPALKQGRSSHKIKDDLEMETIVTRLLITQHAVFCQQGVEKFVPRCGADSVKW
jgi:hypothetical protein